MKPAASIIIFTVFSGYGFGLFFWLGLNAHDTSSLAELSFFSVAFISSALGLISSAFHLGNPQRALKAFSQWRSSWLSREAILALLTLILTTLYMIVLIFFKTKLTWLGILCACFSLLTVFSTSMIYMQMKTVPRWNMKIVPLLFIMHAITGTSIVLTNFLICSFLFFFLGLIQTLCWILGDREFEKVSHIGTATGLSNRRGLVRMLEPPHTGNNYLLKEMVFIVAQKHIVTLRWIALLNFSILPFLISFCCLLFNIQYFVLFVIISVINFFGTLVCRWLFFSEAEHVVGFYYDR